MSDLLPPTLAIKEDVLRLVCDAVDRCFAKEAWQPHRLGSGPVFH